MIYWYVVKVCAMLNKMTPPQPNRRFTVTRSGGQRASTLLLNLMRDTTAPTLAALAERHGLRRMPGLSKEALVSRILTHLNTQAQAALQTDLIATHYGGLSIDELIHLALKTAAHEGRPAPRLDQISSEDAVLVEGGTQRWEYTMRGHDVVIDLAHHTLSCDCTYLTYAAHRQVLCKHLALAFRLIPAVYAREALIDLLVLRQYGEPGARRWIFRALQPAA